MFLMLSELISFLASFFISKDFLKFVTHHLCLGEKGFCTEENNI